MYGIADLDNCYVSCERVFRPDLAGVPVVVLSNNDGCVVARSNEAKAMGIKEGTPYFQLEQLLGLRPTSVATRQSSNMFDFALTAPSVPYQKIAVFSSNYELYGELTGRVVSIISKETPAYFRYSIDECFMYLPSIDHSTLNIDHSAAQKESPEHNVQCSMVNGQWQKWGENLHQRIKREVGMPISIGLAPNKTLAKIASKLAKKYEVYKHCCMIDTDYKREKALEWCPIEDVWGIGRRYATKLQALGCKTALDFAKHHKEWVRLTFNNINIVRTWQELNGEDVVPNEELAKKKSICTSRSFNGMISDIDGLKTHVSNYAARCAEKLRQQNTVATIVGVFLNTNMFREDLAQYWNFQEARLLTPSNSTITIIKAANDVLQRIYRPGYQYKKAGVIVMGIGPDSPIQQDLFDINAEQFQKMKRLDEVVDRINRLHGSETIVLGSQQYTQKDGKGKADVFANAIKHDHKSPCYTTRWSEIIKIKI
jgi:DNA polymerase V